MSLIRDFVCMLHELEIARNTSLKLQKIQNAILEQYKGLLILYIHALCSCHLPHRAREGGLKKMFFLCFFLCVCVCVELGVK